MVLLPGRRSTDAVRVVQRAERLFAMRQWDDWAACFDRDVVVGEMFNDEVLRGHDALMGVAAHGVPATYGHRYKEVEAGIVLTSCRIRLHERVAEAHDLSGGLGMYHIAAVRDGLIIVFRAFGRREAALRCAVNMVCLDCPIVERCGEIFGRRAQ